MDSMGKEIKLTARQKKAFYGKFDRTHACWVWNGAKDTRGYGVLYTGSNPQNRYLAHRLSYHLHKGKFPKESCVLHTCDNRPCVNPEHLFLGTIADNNRDRDKKGRLVCAKGEKHGEAKLKREEVLLLRKIAKVVTCRTLGAIFRISHSQAWRIHRGINWTHL